jgi:hypothetical protein
MIEKPGFEIRITTTETGSILRAQTVRAAS